jgi:hypothetical protein
MKVIIIIIIIRLNDITINEERLKKEDQVVGCSVNWFYSYSANTDIIATSLPSLSIFLVSVGQIEALPALAGGRWNKFRRQQKNPEFFSFLRPCKFCWKFINSENQLIIYSSNYSAMFSY